MEDQYSYDFSTNCYILLLVRYTSLGSQYTSLGSPRKSYDWLLRARPIFHVMEPEYSFRTSFIITNKYS